MRILINTIIAFIVMYLLIAFTGAEIDFTKWTIQQRWWVSLCTFIYLIFSLFYKYLDNK